MSMSARNSRKSALAEGDTVHFVGAEGGRCKYPSHSDRRSKQIPRQCCFEATYAMAEALSDGRKRLEA